jgi:hypothetical protein
MFDYIERFDNAVRRHSTIGYLSPVEFEHNWVSIKPTAAQARFLAELGRSDMLRFERFLLADEQSLVPRLMT